MARTVFTQVYAPDGSWVGFFSNRADASAWVKWRPNAARYEITNRRPTPKESE